MISESGQTRFDEFKNQSLALGSLVGIFERVRAAQRALSEVPKEIWATCINCRHVHCLSRSLASARITLRLIDSFGMKKTWKIGEKSPYWQTGRVCW